MCWLISFRLPIHSVVTVCSNVLCLVFPRVTQIKTHAWDNTSVVIVGNKTDLKTQRVVQKEDGQKLGETLGMMMMMDLMLWEGGPIDSI